MIEIVRATDASLHNMIANHPEVKPTLGYKEAPTDFTPCLDHPDHYVLLSDSVGAAGIFAWSAPGVWQGHSAFLPDRRGKIGIEAGKAMCRWMFEQLNARMLWGMTPIHHHPALVFNRLLGFKPEGEITDEADIRCRLFVMER